MHTIRSELKIENQNKTILLFYAKVAMRQLITNRLPYKRQKPPQQQTIQSYLPASLLVQSGTVKTQQKNCHTVQSYRIEQTFQMLSLLPLHTSFYKQKNATTL